MLNNIDLSYAICIADRSLIRNKMLSNDEPARIADGMAAMLNLNGLTSRQHELLNKALSTFFVKLHQKRNDVMLLKDTDIKRIDPDSNLLSIKGLNIYSFTSKQLKMALQETGAGESDIRYILSNLISHPGTFRNRQNISRAKNIFILKENYKLLSKLPVHLKAKWAKHEKLHLENINTPEERINYEAPIEDIAAAIIKFRLGDTLASLNGQYGSEDENPGTSNLSETVSFIKNSDVFDRAYQSNWGLYLYDAKEYPDSQAHIDLKDFIYPELKAAPEEENPEGQNIMVCSKDGSILRTYKKSIGKEDFNQLDNVIVRNGRLSKAGRFNVGGEERGKLAGYGGRRIDYRVEQGVDEEGKPKSFPTKIMIYDKEGNSVEKEVDFIRVETREGKLVASFLEFVKKKRFDKLDKVTIKGNFKTDANGNFVVGGKSWAAFGKYKDRYIEAYIEQGVDEEGKPKSFPTKIMIYDKEGKNIEDTAEFSRITDKDGKLVEVFSGALTKQKLNRFDNVTISLVYLDEFGSLNISRPWTTLTRYPNRKIEAFIEQGTDENGKTASFPTRLKVFDEKGENIEEEINACRIEDASGALKGVFYSSLSESDFNKFGDICILNSKLTGSGKLSIGEQYWHTFGDYPEHKVKIFTKKSIDTYGNPKNFPIRLIIYKKDGSVAEDIECSKTFDAKGNLVGISYKNRADYAVNAPVSYKEVESEISNILKARKGAKQEIKKDINYENKYNINLFGTLKQSDKLPEDCPEELKKKIEAISNCYNKERAFITIRITDIRNNENLAYFVLYPDNAGNLTLIHSSKAKFLSADIYKNLLALLKTKSDIAINRKFLEKGFEQTINYLGPYYFFNSFIKNNGKKLPAFIETLDTLRGMWDDDLNDRNLEKALMECGINVSFINSSYRLYTHYKEKNVDITELYRSRLEKKPNKKLEAFIETLDELRSISDFRLLNEVHLANVLLGFDIANVLYISSCYKLYMHYKGQGIDITKIYDKNFKANPKKRLRAFINTIEDLRQVSDYELLNEAMLTSTLVALGYPVNYTNLSYKLYSYYKDLDVDIMTVYKGFLSASGSNRLEAFIETMDKLRSISNKCEELTDSNLQGVLQGLGVNMQYITYPYRLYVHFKEKGIDVPPVFDRYLKETPDQKLTAFIATMNYLKEKSDTPLLDSKSLEHLLTGFGKNVLYIKMAYDAYVKCKDKGINIVKLYKGNDNYKNGKKLIAFIEVLELLKKQPGMENMGVVTLESILTGLGVSAMYQNSAYKLYEYYKDIGVDIIETYSGNLEASEGKELEAFINTMAELKSISDFSTLNESHLQQVLAGFGIYLFYINSTYKLFMHYKEKGLDIISLFRENVARYPNDKLKAFSSTLDGLKALSNYKLLNTRNLRGILSGFNETHGFIDQTYKMYNFWKEQGLDVVEYFKNIYGKDGDFNRNKVLAAIDGIENKMIEMNISYLPEGNYRKPLKYYIWRVLDDSGCIKRDIKFHIEKTSWKNSWTSEDMEDYIYNAQWYMENWEYKNYTLTKVTAGELFEKSLKNEMFLPGADIENSFKAVCSINFDWGASILVSPGAKHDYINRVIKMEHKEPYFCKVLQRALDLCRNSAKVRCISKVFDIDYSPAMFIMAYTDAGLTDEDEAGLLSRLDNKTTAFLIDTYYKTWSKAKFAGNTMDSKKELYKKIISGKAGLSEFLSDETKLWLETDNKPKYMASKKDDGFTLTIPYNPEDPGLSDTKNHLPDYTGSGNTYLHFLLNQELPNMINNTIMINQAENILIDLNKDLNSVIKHKMSMASFDKKWREDGGEGGAELLISDIKTAQKRVNNLLERIEYYKILKYYPDVASIINKLKARNKFGISNDEEFIEKDDPRLSKAMKIRGVTTKKPKTTEEVMGEIKKSMSNFDSLYNEDTTEEIKTPEKKSQITNNIDNWSNIGTDTSVLLQESAITIEGLKEKLNNVSAEEANALIKNVFLNNGLELTMMSAGEKIVVRLILAENRSVLGSRTFNVDKENKVLDNSSLFITPVDYNNGAYKNILFDLMDKWIATHPKIIENYPGWKLEFSSSDLEQSKKTITVPSAKVADKTKYALDSTGLGGAKLNVPYKAEEAPESEELDKETFEALDKIGGIKDGKISPESINRVLFHGSVLNEIIAYPGTADKYKFQESINSIKSLLEPDKVPIFVVRNELQRDRILKEEDFLKDMLDIPSFGIIIAEKGTPEAEQFYELLQPSSEDNSILYCDFSYLSKLENPIEELNRIKPALIAVSKAE